MAGLLGLATLGVVKAQYTSMHVSLVIQESCTVDASSGQGKAVPDVACLHDAPYRISMTPVEPVPSSAASGHTDMAGQDGVRTIAF